MIRPLERIMNRRVVALAAGVAMLIAIAVVIGVQAKREFDLPVQAKTLGPENETFAFAADPSGRGGPANDCVVCHSVDKNGPLRSAPSLWGIVGAPKAGAEWFSYSMALRKKGGAWTEEDLDAFLANPSGFIPGTTKTLPPIKDAAKRKQLIAFLKTLHS
jgi:cytochrome c